MRIGSYSRKYNCHGYAWSISRGEKEVWIDAYETGFVNYFSGVNPSYDTVAIIEHGSAPIPQNVDASRAYYNWRHSAYVTDDPKIFIWKDGPEPLLLARYDEYINNYQQNHLYYFHRDHDIIVLKDLTFQTPVHDKQIDSLKINEYIVNIENVLIDSGFNVVIEAEEFEITKNFDCKVGATFEVQ